MNAGIDNYKERLWHFNTIGGSLGGDLEFDEEDFPFFDDDESSENEEEEGYEWWLIECSECEHEIDLRIQSEFCPECDCRIDV